MEWKVRDHSICQVPFDVIAQHVYNIHNITMTTRKLQLQAAVKRFQFDLHLNLEGQHMLVSSWFQR